jgi:X-Pro dipeptidyl-peptidase
VTKPTVDVTQWRVSRGVLDSSNRLSLRMAQPVTIDQPYKFAFPSMPTEHVFGAGHRVGIVIVGTLSGYVAESRGAAITLNTRLSKVSLPLVGGHGAAASSGVIPPGGH